MERTYYHYEVLDNPYNQPLKIAGDFSEYHGVEVPSNGTLILELEIPKGFRLYKKMWRRGGKRSLHLMIIDKDW